jgi:hypothetical protein
MPGSISAILTAVLPVAIPVWVATAPPAELTRVRADRDQVVVGTQRGLYTLGPGGWSLRLGRADILDLALGDHGWLIASSEGLYEWLHDAATPRPVGLTAGARPTSVVIDAEQRSWIATDAGLFCREPENGRFQLETTLPAGAVRSAHYVPGGEGHASELWVATAGELWSLDGTLGGSGRFAPRLRSLESGWWELLGAVRTPLGLLLAVPRGLWRVDGEHMQAIDLAAGDLRAIAVARTRLWIASTRGVLHAPLDALETAVPQLLLAGEAFDLAPAPEGLLAATARGIASIRFDAPAPIALRESAPTGPEPVVLQRAVLTYQGLTTVALRRVEEKMRSAAWLPEVRMGFSFGRDRAYVRDHDQTFSSGAIHQLLDTSRDHDAGFDVSLQLSWELDRLVDPDDAIAISKERRELVELRDQVLERVNRLYFERTRARAALAALPADARGERVELEIRIRELAANLDAWTGGVFSRLESDSSHSSPPHRRRRSTP